MTATPPPIIPELAVADLDRSLAVYLGVFGFHRPIARPEERFAYLVRETAHLMPEEAAGPGRRLHAEPLDHPFGRGMNLQIAVTDVASLYADVQAADLEVLLPLEKRWYRQGQAEVGNHQFVVADPDGYRLRFSACLGRRVIDDLGQDHPVQPSFSRLLPPA